MTNADRFLVQAYCLTDEEYIRKGYQGRNFYKGPAIDCESQHEVDEMRKAMQMECIQDSMGKGFILYPKNPNAPFCGTESIEEDEETERLEDMDTTELIEEWSNRNKFHCLEGNRGVDSFLKLLNACTDKEYRYGSITEALADNPYLIEAMIEAMSEREEYKDNLIKELE